MCGLVAILGSGKPLEQRKSVLDGMLARIAHRGPDGEGVVHVTGQALLGHRRLAVIDLEHGTQPMRAYNGRYSLIFNGEIYNYPELRQSLIQHGEHFDTFSDTEVLLKLLIREGASGISRLNGMFAFVFHDSEGGRWIAARDHFGIKPLYYATPGRDELIFVSEIKALLVHPEVTARRDEGALHQYLALQFCLDDRTLFAGIRKVKPGHYLTGNGASIDQEVCYCCRLHN